MLKEADAPVSAKQLLHSLVNTGAAQIMVLPNGYVAAEELVAGCTAAIGWGIDVVPVPAGSMVQGLAALAVHDAERLAVDDGYTMARAAAGARHGSVRVATEEALTWAGTCKPGDGLAISGDEVLIVAAQKGSAGHATSGGSGPQARSSIVSGPMRSSPSRGLPRIASAWTAASERLKIV